MQIFTKNMYVYFLSLYQRIRGFRVAFIWLHKFMYDIWLIYDTETLNAEINDRRWRLSKVQSHMTEEKWLFAT